MQFFKYLFKVLYSNKEASDIYKKPKWYAYIIFMLSMVILALPFIKYVNTFEYKDAMETYPYVDDVLREFIPTSDLKVINNQLSTIDGDFEEKYVVNDGDKEIVYMVKVLGDYDSIKKSSTIKETYLANITDYGMDYAKEEFYQDEERNIIWFGKNQIYFRYLTLSTDNRVTPYEIYGSYKGFSFDFKEIVDNEESDLESYYQQVAYKMIKGAYKSTSATQFLFLYIVILLIEVAFIFISGIILYFINKKGKRNYNYSSAEGLYAMMSGSLAPAIIASIPALFMMNLVYVLLMSFNIVKFLLMIRVQISPNGKFDDQEERINAKMARVKIAKQKRLNNNNK